MKEHNLQNRISHSSDKPLLDKKEKMDSSPLRSEAHFHVRSVSLPSRSHPLIPQFDELLFRVRSSEATSSSSSSISQRLSGLEDLYESMDNLFLLPHIPQVFAQGCREKWVDVALDGYLRLLDVCGTIRDVFSQTKEHVQEFLSVLRRKRDTDHFRGYLASRKKAKKVIQKSLKDLKSIKNKHTPQAFVKDQETVATVSMLNEVEAVTIAVLESLLSYIVGMKAQSRPSNWSLVSKLMHQKSVECEDEEIDTNEFEKVDAALQILMGHKTRKSDSIVHLEGVQNQLMKLESSIEDLEQGIESLFRHLIKTRVSLLNILNH